MSLSEIRVRIFSPRLDLLARWIAGLTGWKRSAFSFALGAVSVLGFAPFHLWPLLFLTLPSFIWLLDGIALEDRTVSTKPRWRQAALAGWWFGFGFFIASLYWVGFAFFVEAEKFAWLVPFGVAALPAALAIFFALAGAALISIWQPGVRRVFFLTAVFFAVDLLRGHILTGFPWNLWGYALAGNEALAQTASVFGVYGLTALALLIFASPAALTDIKTQGSTRGWVLPVIMSAFLLVGWAWGAARLSAATDSTVPNVRLRIVQANIPQAEKWKPENRDWIFQRYQTLSQKAQEDMSGTAQITHLIWPESSIPYLFMLNDKLLYELVREALAKLTSKDTSLILGAERVEGTKRDDGRYNIDRVFNSLFVLGPNAQVRELYDKVHLVPFGEYIPFEKMLATLGIKQLTHMNTGFSSGTVRPVMTVPGAPPFAPLICYEAIFPAYARGQGERPGWLLNLTNDAWFGVSTGPYQHLHQSRMRAIEQGLPLIRAANTGVSAVIDGHGRVLASLSLGEIGFLDHPLPVALGQTPYARWGEKWLMLLAFLNFLLYRIVIEVE